MTILMVAFFILIIGAFLMYLINPKDIFKIHHTIQEKKSRISSIDHDSEEIIRILKYRPLEPTPEHEHADLLVTKFEECDKKLRSGESSLYRFFGFTSRIISVSLSRSLEAPFSFRDEVYEKFCDDLKKFIKGIENKDFKTFYESIANLLYISSIQQLPNPQPQAIEECITHIRGYTDKFPVYTSTMPLQINILESIDPKIYMFIRYLENVNSYFYDYAQLQGYEPKIVQEERKLIKRLFKRFIKSYEKDNIQEQFRIIRQLSEEPEKLKEFLLPRRIYTPSIEVFAPRACAKIDTSHINTYTSNARKPKPFMFIHHKR